MARGAETFGFAGQVWTTKRIAAVIRREFGIWDGPPAHHGQAVKNFLASGAAARLQLERLAAYAPDLNPVECLWHYLKHVELGNRGFAGCGWLADGLTRALKRLRCKSSVLRSFVRQVHPDL